MHTSENDSNSNAGATGAEPTPAGAISGNAIAAAQQSLAEQARDAAQQLQESLSGFFQEDQRGNENLSRSMDRPSDELGELKREIKDNRRETDRLRDLIRNYRNW